MKAMAPQRSHSIEFKRQVAQEFIAGESLYALIVRPMRVREAKDALERARLWTLAVAAYPPYADYQARTERQIPVFVAEP
jgi:F420H(2)-dependent quinone reductase